MSERFDRERQEALVWFRANKDKEYIDIHIDLDCPACPEDEDPGVLQVGWEDRGKGMGYWVARCKKCGYHAVVSVYEEGARK